ncbi:hypothetical protein N7513_003306 [Penicillium frequentans]|uniref:Uncharacterized protein n=1 Tax=Penicillium frequentans TaxID=3151616 RepID=A0AAD6D0C2_9EURO|nr:hypothetical protein N7494_005310 [Penicillium glabrum]KAJ5557720.1 hypothetical protein N7513_003306 [Penicillium glabrum]
MDAPSSTPDQGKEGEQQATELPIVWEKDNSQESSDQLQCYLLRNRKQKQDIIWRPSPFNPS